MCRLFVQTLATEPSHRTQLVFPPSSLNLPLFPPSLLFPVFLLPLFPSSISLPSISPISLPPYLSLHLTVPPLSSISHISNYTYLHTSISIFFILYLSPSMFSISIPLSIWLLLLHLILPLSYVILVLVYDSSLISDESSLITLV